MKFLRFETTPNPNAIKCVVEPGPVPITPRSYVSAEHFDAEQAGADPLAHALFAIPGVTNVLIHRAFVTVGKTPGAKWPGIKARVRAVLSEPTPDANIQTETNTETETGTGPGHA